MAAAAAVTCIDQTAVATAGDAKANHSAQRPKPKRLTDLVSADEWAWLIERLKLSPREAEYLDFAADDPREKEIARRMGLSVHTAHTHRRRLCQKLGVDGMARALSAVFAVCLEQRLAFADGRRR